MNLSHEQLRKIGTYVNNRFGGQCDDITAEDFDEDYCTISVVIVLTPSDIQTALTE
jgi:hypothetical protein